MNNFQSWCCYYLFLLQSVWLLMIHCRYNTYVHDMCQYVGMGTTSSNHTYINSYLILRCKSFSCAPVVRTIRPGYDNAKAEYQYTIPWTRTARSEATSNFDWWLSIRHVHQQSAYRPRQWSIWTYVVDQNRQYILINHSAGPVIIWYCKTQAE